MKLFCLTAVLSPRVSRDRTLNSIVTKARRVEGRYEASVNGGKKKGSIVRR